jgi:phospholipid/cholesterol/gamma-HCH transport system substrate-binding protein
MPRQKTTMSELRVGMLALATIVILVVFILSVTGDISIFRDTREYRTRFAAADGLKSGDEVRLAGKRVGQVEQVELGPVPSSTDESPKPIIVTMSVNSGEVGDRIRTDSVAVLGQQGFLGDRVIDISPGTTSGDVLQEGAEIRSADQASMAQVFGGANDLLVQFNRVGQQLQELMDNINQGKGTIGMLLHDDALYVNLNRAVVEGQSLLRRVQEGNGTIARFLNDPTLYNDLRGLTNDLKAVTADVQAGRGTLGKFLKDEELYRQANAVVARANSMVEKFDRITADLEAGRGTLGKFIKDEKLHSNRATAPPGNFCTTRSFTTT